MTSTTMRSGASAYHPELAVNVRQWKSQWCQSKGHCASAPTHCKKDHAHICHRVGGADNMAVGYGEVVIGRAGASCTMLLRAILARMASRGAARRVHSAQMHRIAVSMGSGGITSTIMHSLSPRRYFASTSSWCRLSLANAGAADAVVYCVQPAALLSLAKSVTGNTESDDTVGCSTATVKAANTAAYYADKERHCSLASAVSANVAPHFAVFWQQRSLARVVSINTAVPPPTLINLFLGQCRLHQ